jgi:hypothetical protein
MFPRHPASLLVLLAVGCSEVHAQPRRDAGAVRRPAPSVRPRFGIAHDGPPRWLLDHGDASVPPAFLGADTDDGADLGAQLDRAAATSQPAPIPASGEGVGTLSLPRSDGRFDDPENLAGVPLPEVRSWLAVAGGWTLRCLERAPEVDPFTLPVRFTVGRDGSVSGVTAEGAADGVQRCLTEGFGHARFRPKAQPVELVARYRYTVRWRRPRGARDAGVPDGGRAP